MLCAHNSGQLFSSACSSRTESTQKYHYGKAVQGTMRVTLCQKARRRLQNVSKDICREYSGQTVSKGCFTPSVSTSVFNLAPSEADSKIYAEASLLEAGTGTCKVCLQSFSAEKDLVLLLEELTASAESCSASSRQIKLQDHHGNGMKNRKVYLVIKFMRRRLIKMYITDGNGRASFNLDTTAWNSSSVFLEVNPTSAHRRVKSLKLCQCSLLLPCSPLTAWSWVPHTVLLGRFTLEDLTHTPWKTGVSYTNAYHHLQPFHVTTKSFLDIHPLTGTLPCGLKQSVQVTFTLSRDDLGEDTSRIGFAYYVTGKAGIVVRGQRSVQVGKLNSKSAVACLKSGEQLGLSTNRVDGDKEAIISAGRGQRDRASETMKGRETGRNLLKGSFSIPLTFTADFTPSPSLVVYAIFPGGGITADSIRFDVALCFENEVRLTPRAEGQLTSWSQQAMERKHSNPSENWGKERKRMSGAQCPGTGIFHLAPPYPSFSLFHISFLGVLLKVKVGFLAKEAHPESTAQLRLQAAPGSVCAVQAVDENMFLVRPESELTSQMVYGLFPAIYRHGYPAQVEEYPDHCVQPHSTSPLLQGKLQHSFQPDIFNLFWMEQPSDRWGLLVVDVNMLRCNRCCCHSLTARSVRPQQEQIGHFFKSFEKFPYLHVP
ncbi:Alpha-2-macroglobulin-like protein 1 [Aix galericulata]|nr:Alpha-2-macroglobulin-like protein 1 [Aix galericulata]